MNKIKCKVCPHNCSLGENQTGLCNVRTNINGVIVSDNYGEITSIALDPIEKKPLKKFYPGSKILSVGSYGCNLKCDFCQNYEISTSKKNELNIQHITPKGLVQVAEDLRPNGNIGIAYTYNEPLIGYEFVRDTAKLSKSKHLKNAVVTNGYFCTDTIMELVEYIDAFNIDLKAFTDEFYENIGGDLETVMNFIKLASKYTHVEITTLIIPEENDSEDEILKLSNFIASINKNIPLHISRFFPCYKMTDKKPTEVKKIYKLADIARKQLNHVYEGNC